MKKSKDGEDGLLPLRTHQQQKLASSLPHITELRPFKNPAFYLTHRHVSSCATTEGSDGCARGKKNNSRVRRMCERKKKKKSRALACCRGMRTKKGKPSLLGEAPAEVSTARRMEQRGDALPAPPRGDLGFPASSSPALGRGRSRYR